MSIYYFMFNAKPLPDNPESEEFGGAYINCWISSNSREEAYETGKSYCYDEGWSVLNIKEQFIARREQYEELPESLECYDQAIETGVAGMFNVWPIDTEDNDIDYD